MSLYDTMYIMDTNKGASNKGKWTTVRVSFDLYERLRQRKKQTQLPIATMVRLAVEQYLDERTNIAETLVDIQKRLSQLEQRSLRRIE